MTQLKPLRIKPAIRIPMAVISGLCALLSACAHAADADTPVGPCADPAYSEFDFWLGDWQVYKRETGKLAGVDQIEKTLDGCAVKQTWIQLDDSFKPEGGTGRLKGSSLISRLPNGEWRQTWVDNSGYFNTFTGGLNSDGTMILESGAVQYPGRNGGFANVYFKWHWKLQDDGTVRSWGTRKVGDSGDWEASFDNLYRRNQ